MVIHIHDSKYILDDSSIPTAFARGRMKNWQFEDKRAEISSNYRPAEMVYANGITSALAYFKLLLV